MASARTGIPTSTSVRQLAMHSARELMVRTMCRVFGRAASVLVAAILGVDFYTTWTSEGDQNARIDVIFASSSNVISEMGVIRVRLSPC